MSFPTFLVELLETGRVHLAAPGVLSADEQSEADEVLVTFEREFRRELPGEAPEFSLAAARWGALAVFHACQFLVYRDVDAALLSEALGVACPEPPNSATHYSVDLTMRFLPDVARLARVANPDDPLLRELRRLASQWPLSSVGMSGVEPETITAIVDHPCLLAMYVDRVLAARDVTRLADPHVHMALRTAIGLHEQLAPEIAAALRTTVTEDTLS